MSCFSLENESNVNLGWCVVAERLVMWVLPNFGMGDHNLAAMLDDV
jgi:hypothetical protein